mmetsp:Transcript_12453/g.19279  ORF Transcript_12453/g.19279 Transcript_12453/m.19279 type:complete len:274 (+) Transcript_12453:88-909(+)
MLSNVVGIISGGASGLGAATATCLVRNGAKVIVADLENQRDNFLRLATHACAIPEVSDIDPDAVLAFAPTDVTNTDDVTNALDMAENHFGEPVNAAISCAGVANAKKTLSKKRNTSTLSPHPLDDFQKTLSVNTIGSFNLARLAAARMAERDPDTQKMRGCIINTASIAAYDGQIGQVAYAASKGALVGMTLPMARDLATFGIRVMTIAPGPFRTPILEALPETVLNEIGKMVPCPSRLGDPDEFGQLVMSILTNPMLNGEVIRLDGALRMPP